MEENGKSRQHWGGVAFPYLNQTTDSQKGSVEVGLNPWGEKGGWSAEQRPGLHYGFPSNSAGQSRWDMQILRLPKAGSLKHPTQWLRSEFQHPAVGLQHCSQVSWAPRNAVITLDHPITDSNVYQLPGDQVSSLWLFFFSFSCTKTSSSQPTRVGIDCLSCFPTWFCWQNQTWLLPRLSRGLFTLA